MDPNKSNIKDTADELQNNLNKIKAELEEKKNGTILWHFVSEQIARAELKGFLEGFESAKNLFVKIIPGGAL